MYKYMNKLFFSILAVFVVGSYTFAWGLDAPVIYAAAKGPNQVNLTWSAVANPGWGYKVEIQSSGDSRYSSWTDLTALLKNGVGYLPYWVTEAHYTDPQDASACQFPVFSLLNNTTYNFRVRTYGKTDAGVATHSSYSTMATATTRNYTVRHVRTDGNDANAGTSDTAGGAWRHVYYAAAHATAGTVVYIHAGTYTADYLTSSASGTTGVDTKIVFMAHQGETVTINSGSGAVKNFYISHNRIVLDGLKFVVTGRLAGNQYEVHGNNNAFVNMEVDHSLGLYSPLNRGNYNLYHNSYFHDCGTAADDDSDIFTISSATYNIFQYCHSQRGSHSGMLVANGSHYNQIMNNLFDGGYGSGWHEVDYTGSITYNLYEGNIIKDVAKSYSTTRYKPMVQISGSYATMRRNLVYDGLSASGQPNTNYSTHGVELSHRPGGTGVLVYNNVFYYNGGWGICFISGYGDNTYDTIANNIFYYLRGGNGDSSSCPTYYFINQTGRSGTSAHHNCFLYKWAGGDVPGTAMIHMTGDAGVPQTLAHQEAQFPTEIHDNVETTPSFLNAANREFHLKSTSGLRGKGTTITDSTWGTINQTDIGVFKYYVISDGGSSPPPPPPPDGSAPSPPTGLRIE